MKNNELHIQFSGALRSFENICEIVEFVFQKFGLDESDSEVFAIAVGEACQNAIQYGVPLEAQNLFELELVIRGDIIKAIVINRGKPFDFENIPPFDKSQKLDRYENGGLGIPLMKKVLDEVTYTRKEGRNILTLTKNIGKKTMHTNQGSDQ